MKEITESITQLLRERLSKSHTVVTSSAPKALISNVIVVYRRLSNGEIASGSTHAMSVTSEHVAFDYNRTDTYKIFLGDPDLIDRIVDAVTAGEQA